MTIYTWNGPEENLGRTPIAATRMSVDAVKDLPDGRKYAEGTFEFTDYIENSHGHDPWEAFGVVGRGGKFAWTVLRKNDGDFCFQGENGEMLFTLIESVNVAIKKFIAKRLDEVVARILKGEPALIDTTGGVQLEVLPYDGPCLCDWFVANGPIRPSHSETLVPAKPTPLQAVAGKQYLENCFACSCGTKWWNCENGVWAKVGDPVAWQMLITHGGKEMKTLGFFEGAFYLLQTLRNQGLIPIG